MRGEKGGVHGECIFVPSLMGCGDTNYTAQAGTVNRGGAPDDLRTRTQRLTA
jgi:hypothetical protein